MKVSTAIIVIFFCGVAYAHNTPKTTTAAPTTPPPPPPVPEEDNCEPEPVCHQCLNGVFPSDLCCRDVQTFYKLNLADAKNCSWYFQCVNGHAIHRQCPEKLHWSVNTDRCEWPATAQCKANDNGGNNGNDGGNEGGNNGGNEGGNNGGNEGGNNGGNEGGNNEGNEGGNNGGSEGGNEGGNESGNEGGNNGGNEGGNEGGNNGGNDGEVSADCISGKVSADECCKNVPESIDVLLQNNADCHTYIQCVHQKPMVRPCPAGLFWSITMNRCEWQDNATCTW